MVQKKVPFGVVALHLDAGVAFMQEEDAVFKAMMEGWEMQQRGGRTLQKATVQHAVMVVRRFQKFAGLWPWQWGAADLDDWMTHLVAVRRLAPTTIRSYQTVIRSFCSFLCSEHYGWAAECEKRFGTHPTQICHDWNTRRHIDAMEGSPRRRPLTREELQILFDFADSEVERRLSAGRKGAVTAFRDATLLKVAYAWGLRAQEAVKLDITDFYRNPHAPQFGRFGMLQVRFGKGSRGGGPRRRSVVTVRPWVVPALEQYIESVWPLMRAAGSNALWLSERGTQLRTRELQECFARYRDALGFDRTLTPHALRHSYVTHLVEEGVDPTFVQQQVGHTHQSTTAIYTAVSGDFANTMMRQALERTLTKITEPKDTN